MAVVVAVVVVVDDARTRPFWDPTPTMPMPGCRISGTLGGMLGRVGTPEPMDEFSPGSSPSADAGVTGAATLYADTGVDVDLRSGGSAAPIHVSSWFWLWWCWWCWWCW